MKAAIRDDNPVLFFEHKLSYNAVRGEVPQGDYFVPIGEAAVRRNGTQLSLSRTDCPYITVWKLLKLFLPKALAAR
ncbi:MAG: hypothetical protein CM1200mP22_32400 [Dehalococcoidia bacterium]|nr:MAG: hypothetical protein CM1200mP22_32400 [Dehalococcoidia bacterium]